MVGGFSESPILQKYIRNHFGKNKVVVPRDAGLAVLRGAVLFGQNPRAVVARVTKYSYGVASFEKFNPKHHKSTKKDRDLCADVFDVHVERGTTLQIEHAAPKRIYRPNREDQKEIDIELYVCEQDKLPKYIDDEGCHYLGNLTVEFPNTKGGLKREVSVQLIFGGTELRVRAENNITHDTYLAKFDFLGNEP
jgi:molecular chaperone DnaK (HSP70)